MKRIRELSVYAYIILLSWYRTIFRWNLGEQVHIKGMKGEWTLYQGVDHPYWKASQTVNGISKCVVAHEKDIRKVWTKENMRATFQSCISFYMNNWYNVWIDKL